MPSMYKNAKLIDATEPLDFVVTKQDLELGVPLSNDACAGARGIKRAGFVAARVYRNSIHVQKKCDAPVQRYMTNEVMRMIEAFNDLKAIPRNTDEWKVRLDPPSKANTLKHRRKWEKRRRAARNKKIEKVRNLRRAITGRGQVRVGPNAKDMFGIRATAPRSTEW